jgi:hypothetical protein
MMGHDSEDSNGGPSLSGTQQSLVTHSGPSVVTHVEQSVVTHVELTGDCSALNLKSFTCTMHRDVHTRDAHVCARMHTHVFT